MDWMNETTEQMPKGAFLMVDGNPMTIGWCQYGVLWGKRTCTIYVRKSRYTHQLLDNAATFTVSVPALGTMRKELAYCGTRSGRDGDKLQAIHAALSPARFGAQDGYLGCKTHIECRILYRQDLSMDGFDDDAVRQSYYGAGDEHTVYVGEILGVYEEPAV